MHTRKSSFVRSSSIFAFVLIFVFHNKEIFALHAYHVGFKKAGLYRDLMDPDSQFDELEMIPNDIQRAYVARILRDQRCFELLLEI